MTDPACAVGVLLAAGAGSRAGGPKALHIDPDGISWLRRSSQALSAGGCHTVLVVLGCAAVEAQALLRRGDLDQVRAVVAPDWATGLAASLRTGLTAALHETAQQDGAQRIVVHLVDLPDVGAAVIRRLLEVAAPGPDVLARATYDGRPGHPVLIGRHHVPPLLMTLSGDQGAGSYLREHGASPVECGDLATGVDRDEAGTDA